MITLTTAVLMLKPQTFSYFYIIIYIGAMQHTDTTAKFIQEQAGQVRISFFFSHLCHDLTMRC